MGVGREGRRGKDEGKGRYARLMKGLRVQGGEGVGRRHSETVIGPWSGDA